MEAKELCLAGGLSVADVFNELDLESLRNFIKGVYNLEYYHFTPESAESVLNK